MTTTKPKPKLQRVHVTAMDPITKKSRTTTLYETTVDGFFRELAKLVREKKQSVVAKSA